MGSHSDCSDWDYENHPKRARIAARCARLIKLLLARPKRFLRYGYDTRRGHVFMFTGMAPTPCPCIVGHYRGSSSCPELTNYRVTVHSDPRVGIHPAMVAWQIGEFEAECAQGCAAFEAARSNGTLPPQVHLLRFAELLAVALERFLWIHPYANGNGHSGRLLLWVLMTRHGFPSQKWPLDESPDYGKHLKDYRDGNRKPLVRFILQAMR